MGRYLFRKMGVDRAVATYCNNPIEGGVYFDSVSMKLDEILKDPRGISHGVILLGDTDPDSCVADIKVSQTLNVESLKASLICLKKWKIKPIFTSSEFVFDGLKGNYTETDNPQPILTYGRQKLEIEKFIQEKFNEFVILRLGKVFGSEFGDGTIFSNWIESIEHGKTIYCANDQVVSPIYVEDVVEGIIRVIRNDCNGIFHLSGKRAFVRQELLEILLKDLRKYSKVKVKIIQQSIHDFPLKEKRPLDVSMKSDKLVRVTKLKLTDADKICRKMVKERFVGKRPSASAIILNDPESVFLDKSGKTPAYFCKKKPIGVSRDLIKELKNIVINSDNKNIRLCLHESPEASFHNMVILEQKGRYYRPHKHLTKGESFHIIEGSMAVFTFDDQGAVTDACILDNAGNFIYKVGINMYHAVMPLSDFVVYHEVKPGPFLGDKDSIYPPWAPSGDEPKEIKEYLSKLRGIVKSE